MGLILCRFSRAYTDRNFSTFVAVAVTFFNERDFNGVKDRVLHRHGMAYSFPGIVIPQYWKIEMNVQICLLMKWTNYNVYSCFL
jgi:hypothetical protein